MLRGVKRGHGGAITHSIVMRSHSGTVRFIEAHHNFVQKDLVADLAVWRLIDRLTACLGVSRSLSRPPLAVAAGGGPGGRRHRPAAGVPEIVGRLLAARGIGIDAAADFLEPTLRALLPDPSLLVDMDIAADRLADAVRARRDGRRCSATTTWTAPAAPR